MRSTAFGTLGRNALFLILTYVATFLAVQATQRVVGPESLAPLASMMLVQIVAFVIAPRVGARAAGYLVGLFGATLIAEFVIQTAYGVKSIHSAPVHYAVMLAAALGTGFGALLTRKSSTTTKDASEPSPQSAR